MVCYNSKRVVIIKNISSNIVEEAILVLKDKEINNSKNKKAVMLSEHSVRKANNYLIKEAEEIINNYMKESKLKDSVDLELNLKPFSPRKKSVNTFINLALVASIALLVFLVAKIF